MNRRILTAAFALATATCLSGAHAQTWTAQLSDSVGSPTSVDIAPGDSFGLRFDLLMIGGATANAVDYHFALSGNGGLGSGKVSLAQRSRATSLFSDPSFSDAAVQGVLNPATLNLGAATNPFQDLTGNQFVASYTFSTTADLPLGTYLISIDQSQPLGARSVTDADFNARPIAASYTVNVVPEPACLGAIAAAIAVGLRRRRA
jgi:hypothetical protein